MQIELTDTEFNPWEKLQQHEARLLNERGKWGAVSTFVGAMRDYNEGDDVRGMFLEHYPGMTERYLEKISETAMQDWDILDTLVIHRVGHIQPGENIVLTAAWAGHRDPAFQACRYLIEELKHRAPFWKKETLHDGERWVAFNTPATSA